MIITDATHADPSIKIGSWFEVALTDRAGKYLSNESLYLASACVTFGFERRAIPATRIFSKDAPERVGWWINVRKQSETGYHFADIWKGWFKPETVPADHRVHNVRRYAQHHQSINRARRTAPRISPEDTIRRKTVSYISGCTNTKQAASLLELGFSLDVQMPVSITDVAGRDQATFWFALPPDQKPAFLKCVEGWVRFGEFESRDPEHPMCYHRTYGENREKLMADYEKTMPMTMVRRGGRWLIVTENLNGKNKRQLERML